MKRYALPLLLFFAVIFISFISCSKKNEPKVDQTPEPTISSISRASGWKGEAIIVYGKNFSTDVSKVRLTINEAPAKIIALYTDSIKAEVPPMAGSGDVEVQVANKKCKGPEFTYNYKVTVSTIAGTGGIAAGQGPGYAVGFYCPWGITVDKKANLYIADLYNRLIRRIDALTNMVTTISIPVYIGPATFTLPYNITVDDKSGNLYVTDFNDHVMKIGPALNMEVIYSGIQPTTGVALGPDGFLYISDNTRGTIMKMDTSGGNRTQFAAGLITPRNIVFDKDGNLYVPGTSIYKIDRTGHIYTIPQDKKLEGWEIVRDTSGNFFEADHFNNRIRMIDKKGRVKVIAGNGNPEDVDGIGLNSSFNGPQGLAIDANGNLYVTTYNHDTRGGNKVRKVTLE